MAVISRREIERRLDLEIDKDQSLVVTRSARKDALSATR